MISISKAEPFSHELDFKIKENDIKLAISALRKGNAAGLDDIENEMIKLSQNVFLSLYTNI